MLHQQNYQASIKDGLTVPPTVQIVLVESYVVTVEVLVVNVVVIVAVYESAEYIFSFSIFGFPLP